ncbi:MAG: RNA 3'-terminal phosphate cyclase [Proteobacteria bacterium]|nr:RNA 3'-terminal phosphate cyclase [Pseudomonadota bacterium]
MLTIDGSMGEGGGQILRTALGLGLVTGTPFTLESIRAKRAKPGLLRQHLACVRAAEAIGARVEGAELGSGAITVHPEAIRPGEYTFAVGSAGSAGLVLQAVLPPLLVADGPSRLVLEGGTHNPWAPPFDLLERVFLPVLARMGARVSLKLERAGFYPAGGGRYTVEIDPVKALRPIELMERGEVVRRKATALFAHVAAAIGQRELAVVRQKLDWAEEELVLHEVKDSPGPGNVLLLEVASEHAHEMVAGFGEKGVHAEKVARRAAGRMRVYLESGVPVGRWLADQLMIPMALAGEGGFRTLALSEHSRTNLEVIQRFLPVRIAVEEKSEHDVWVRFERTREV